MRNRKDHGNNDVSHFQVSEIGRVELSANVARAEGLLKPGAASWL